MGLYRRNYIVLAICLVVIAVSAGFIFYSIAEEKAKARTEFMSKPHMSDPSGMRAVAVEPLPPTPKIVEPPTVDWEAVEKRARTAIPPGSHIVDVSRTTADDSGY